MNEAWWVGEDQLDPDQKAIAALPPRGSHLITGPPGCGKTNLILLRAKYYTKLKKENILVLVFTRALRDFIISGSKQYHLAPQIVSTSRHWAHDILREHGQRFNPTGAFEDQRKQLLEEVTKVARNESLRHRYDAIFLDEAQDYLPEEIELFRYLGKEIYASADSRQKIYPGPNSLETLRKLVDEVHPLRFHYRLGRKICRVADSIYVGAQDESLFSTSQYKEKLLPSSVEALLHRNVSDQATEIIKRLKIQKDAYPNELLGVMCPHREQRDQIYELISQSDIGQYAVNQSDDPVFEPSKPIYVSTLHSSKGLEYRATHIAFAESIKGFDFHKNMSYTAITRTKTALTIHSTGQLAGYLKSALNSLEPTPDEPSLTDLFK